MTEISDAPNGVDIVPLLRPLALCLPAEPKHAWRQAAEHGFRGNEERRTAAALKRVDALLRLEFDTQIVAATVRTDEWPAHVSTPSAGVSGTDTYSSFPQRIQRSSRPAGTVTD
jgi:hypothetical protein